MTIALSILGISLLIVVHELGHFLVARACKMRVLRFSVGFGPALWQRQVGDTTWQVAAIPLGGFVQIHGMGPQEQGTDGSNKAAQQPPAQPTKDPDSFSAKPLWQRFLVIFAGPATNWLAAAAIIAVMALTLGFERPNFSVPGVGTVQQDSPAAAANLQSGDVLIEIGGERVSDWDSLVAVIEAHPEQELVTTLQRNGAVVGVVLTPARHPATGKGYLGITPPTVVERFGVVQSLQTGFVSAWLYTQQYAGLVWDLVKGGEQGQLAGLPGIVKAMSAQAEESLRRFWHTVAWLSIGLFLLNLLPIPALDGSRLVFLGLEAVRGRPVDERIEGITHAVGFMLLLGLMILVSVRDLM